MRSMMMRSRMSAAMNSWQWVTISLFLIHVYVILSFSPFCIWTQCLQPFVQSNHNDITTTIKAFNDNNQSQRGTASDIVTLLNRKQINQFSLNPFQTGFDWLWVELGSTWNFCGNVAECPFVWQMNECTIHFLIRILYSLQFIHINRIWGGRFFMIATFCTFILVLMSMWTRQ